MFSVDKVAFSIQKRGKLRLKLTLLKNTDRVMLTYNYLSGSSLT